MRSTDEAPAQITSTEEKQNQDQTSSEPNPKEIKDQADQLIAEGKKAIALKQWEEGVNKYGEALDLMRQLVGETDPSMAPLLLSYGKALYELAFSQQGVMGKDEGSKEADEAVRQGALEEAPAKNGNFVFSADPTSDDDDEDDQEVPAGSEAGPSTSTSVPATTTPAEGEEGGENEGNDEPEDDYNAAWEVLDVARTIYAKIVEDKADGDEGRDEKLNLADCYLALGDVSCETENFPQAVQDYTSALSLQSALLPSSSRQLASTHYQLATVLEFTPDRRSDALDHVEKALSAFKERLTQLESSDPDSEEVKKLSDKEKENEVKDVKNLIEDLRVKIDELKITSTTQTNDIISKSIDHLWGGQSSDQPLSSAPDNAPVNDLTSMVRKKKPKTIPTAAQASKAVEEVKKVVGEMVQNAQQTSEPIIEAGKEQLTNVAELVQQKAGEVASSAGESLQSAGEGLKREGEQDEQEERKSKKAKTE
ncbi:uncharacterized protein IL334_004416 [Kwoniella shivajii]|uniref:Tetratricopeptide SHNi-TPR domain-containing protein n=1 Tax=Kwoniella shivajii TaxID=564305 RepID=A0ABZ1D211_9TREE|nr:hypothetical protein IL334_004416 [Kwoniella shivajii]